MLGIRTRFDSQSLIGATVTTGYSHRFAGKLKLALLEKRTDHAESLIKPAEVVAVLR
jgi:hypothetical protein